MQPHAMHEKKKKKEKKNQKNQILSAVCQSAALRLGGIEAHIRPERSFFAPLPSCLAQNPHRGNSKSSSRS